MAYRVRTTGVVRAGERRCWVHIQTRTVAAGIVTWPVRASAWAQIDMLRGTEQIEAKKLLAGRVGRIRFGYSDVTALITPKDRLKFKARVFHIETAINVDERNREIECMVVEQVA